MGSLRFRLFGFPVEIQPGFWLLAAIIAFGPKRSALEIATWVAVILVSVLVHELGHAVAARAYGQQPSIALHMMGGLTSWAPTHELGAKRRILVTLAGPGAGFALGALAYVALLAMAGQTRGGEATPSEVESALALLCVANLFWSAINLLPVLPFDGGQIMATALGPSRRQLAAGLSLVFGLVVAAVLLRMGSVLGAVIFALGGISSFLAARQQRQGNVDPRALEEILERARGELGEGRPERAGAMAQAVLTAAPTPDVARSAAEIWAWSALDQGDVARARALLREPPGGLPFDALLEGAIHDADGDAERAARVLYRAREASDQRPELLALLVRVELGRGRAADAARLAVGLVSDTDAAELRRVADEAAGTAAIEAARLSEALFAETGDPNDAFTAARYFARAGEVDEAIAALARAKDAGHPNPESARDDDDLRALRDHDEFERALAGGGSG